jgi:acyl-CoA reductase-like NAD-dependent aldehyde dehydrogenase
MTKLSSYNPATGELIREIKTTPIASLPKIFEDARRAQSLWARTTLRYRSEKLKDFRETIITHLDELTDLLSKENGKPKIEALLNDLFPTVELLTFTASVGKKALKKKRISMRNPVLKHRISYLQPVPLGVLTVISPWNFPFFLPFGEIAMGLMAGNAIVFKPSEITPLIGEKIQELAEEAGFPPGLLQTVIGDGKLGAALIQQKPDKIFFTGSVSTGKRITEAAAKHLIPVNLELGGKDAMIVFPDVDLDHATSAALWGGFANSGQVCASVERLILHESIADQFTDLLKEKITKLRQGNPASAEVDLGAITLEKQKDVYDAQLKEAEEKEAKVLIGGKFSEDRNFFPPTLISGENIETLKVYQQETFGPFIAITRFRSVSEAIQKANSTQYGLTASIMTNNFALAEEIAPHIEAGTVTINEVTYTAGVPETPWGGVKESGLGKKHSELGFHEFVHLRHIHKPRAQFLTHKSLWWYPYTPYQYQTFRQLFELYRKSWFYKAKALPLFLWNFIQFIKTEKRL